MKHKNKLRKVLFCLSISILILKIFTLKSVRIEPGLALVNHSNEKHTNRLGSQNVGIFYTNINKFENDLSIMNCLNKN